MATRCLSCMKQISSEICPHCSYPSVRRNKEHQLPVGTMLRERYQLGQVLGQGGFGITYLAWDDLMQKRVAVKEFYPSGYVYRKNTLSSRVECTSQDVVPHYEYSADRFLREARALVQFRDIPEVVDILDFVKENNTSYIVMEFVKGVDLAKYIRRKGDRLSVEETFRILKPVMQALAKVHKSGIVHRDISPDNIILDPMGGAKLLDFGAVRAVENPAVDKALSKSTEAILKQGFAPMEQYNTRGSLGPWTDEYAMCATVWYCLTGNIPEEAPLRMTEGIDPDWSGIPGLPVHQQKALEKGFSLRPRDRYPDMDSLLAALFPAPAEEEISETATVIVDETENFQKTVSVSDPMKTIAQESGDQLSLTGKLITQKQIPEEDIAPQEPDNGISPADELVTRKQATTKGRKKWKILLPAAAVLAVTLVVLLFPGKIDRYKEASALMEAGQYAEAAAAFDALGNYKDSIEKLEQCRNAILYQQAEQYLEEEDYYQAAISFYAAADYRDARERSFSCWRYFHRPGAQQTISAGVWHTVGIKTDGTVVAVGRNEYGACNVADWEDIVSISAGNYHTVGLKADGTVVAVGSNSEGQCNVAHWRDIVAVSAGDYHAVGLKADGTVVAVGLNSEGQCNVADWRDIVAVSAGDYHTVGLKADGTVVAVGLNNTSQCDVAGWHNIVAIGAGMWHTVGLKADGTMVAVGDSNGRLVSDWRDIVAVCAAGYHTLGLRADGTPVVVGWNEYGRTASVWRDVVALCTGSEHAVGVKADGTVVAVGLNDYGQCDVDSWKDIRVPG